MVKLENWRIAEGEKFKTIIADINGSTDYFDGPRVRTKGIVSMESNSGILIAKTMCGVYRLGKEYAE